jgi:GNAT superfamily N-acetyltransferase
MKHIADFEAYIAEKYILPKSHRVKNLLYHASAFNNILSILKNNILRGTQQYDYGVATSRSKDYLFFLNFEDGNIQKGGADAQLILDRDKIKSRYKVVPFDWEEFKLTDDPNYHQSEDKVLTNAIENVEKYIVGIQLNKAVHRSFHILWADEEIREKIVRNKWNVFDMKWNLLVENGEIVQETKSKYNFTIYDQNAEYVEAGLQTDMGKILVTGQMQGKLLKMTAYHKNIEIGYAKFYQDRFNEKSYDTDDVFVEEAFRRKGVASVMYDVAIIFAASNFIRIEPKHNMDDATKALWNSF